MQLLLFTSVDPCTYALRVHQTSSFHNWSPFSFSLPCSEHRQNPWRLSPAGCTAAPCPCQPCTLERRVGIICLASPRFSCRVSIEGLCQPTANLAHPGVTVKAMAQERPISCPVRGGDTQNHFVYEEQPVNRRKGNPGWHRVWESVASMGL